MTAGMRLGRELRHVAGVFYERLMIDCHKCASGRCRIFLEGLKNAGKQL